MAKRTNRVALGLVVVVAAVAGSAALLAIPDYCAQIDEPLSWVIFITELPVMCPAAVVTGAVLVCSKGWWRAWESG